MNEQKSPLQIAISFFFSLLSTKIAAFILLTFVFIAIYAPFLSREAGIIWIDETGVHFPIFSELFDSNIFSEEHDVFFNCLAILSPFFILFFILRKFFFSKFKIKNASIICFLTLLCFYIFIRIPLFSNGNKSVSIYRGRATNSYDITTIVTQRKDSPADIFKNAKKGTVLQKKDDKKIVKVFCRKGEDIIVKDYNDSSKKETCKVNNLSYLKPTFSIFPLFSHNFDTPYKKASLKKPFTRNPTTDSLFILGTDDGGKDVLARMFFGARISLMIGFLATGISMFIGLIIGAVSGYFGGKTDLLLQRFVEIMMNFPTFILLLIILSIYPKSIGVLIIVFGLTGWAGTARLVRGEFMTQKENDYVLAAECMGFTKARIMFRHMLPNILTPIMISATFGIAGTILGESGLAFLGLLDPNTPSWGILLNEARSHPSEIHLMYTPGITIFLLVTALNLLGNNLRAALNPKESN